MGFIFELDRIDEETKLYHVDGVGDFGNWVHFNYVCLGKKRWEFQSFHLAHSIFCGLPGHVQRTWCFSSGSNGEGISYELSASACLGLARIHLIFWLVLCKVNILLEDNTTNGEKG